VQQTVPHTQEWSPRGGLSKRAVEILGLLAEGMSDREIAERLVMTIGTVKWYNRQVYRALGVGSRTQAIAQARQWRLLNTDAGADSAPPLAFPTVHRASAHNLPVESTRFIGRIREKVAIKRLLESAHLLTLVGPPGTGKTRLALQVAWELAGTFQEGAYFVSLAPINDPALVLNAIASAIGVTDAPGRSLIVTLKHALRESPMLLVLDNFEHVLAAAPYISELLSAAPRLKVLATSREPLHLYGEQEYAVPPLEVPDLDDQQYLDLQALAACEATALFIQQARAVRADFELVAENAVDIAEICMRLDGLPLAIELAAARIKLLTPRTLLARLNHPISTLTGGAHDLPARQQTLRNTITWSYNLLTASEKVLFTRLAIFHGGCSLEAIEAVCGDDRQMDVLAQLSRLVDKSLIQQKGAPDGEPRFIMLGTIREYARERLAESGEEAALSLRHAEYFAELAERAEPDLRRAPQWHWFRLLEMEHENLRAVLTWSIDEGDRTLGVRLAGALCLFWFARGHHAEGWQWTHRLLNELDTVPARHHAKLLLTAGLLAWLYDLDAAKHYCDLALPISRELGNQVNTAWALAFKGYAMMRETAKAVAVAEEGLALFRALRYQPGIAQSLNIIGEIARLARDDERARRAYEECLIVSQETGETRRIRFMFSNLSCLARHAGDYERARALAAQGLRIAIEMDNNLDIADGLAELAGVLGGMGRLEQAARLLGTWEAALERMGAVPQPVAKAEHDRTIAAVRAQLDPPTFAAAWATGRATALQRAVASAGEYLER
jgi:predicted ATPase/DNA-binding CsgD family transcriptional regulator